MSIEAKQSQQIPGIALVRHGLTPYNQGNVSAEDANDLTEEGIDGVIAEAERLISTLYDHEGNPLIKRVRFFSSPKGRALHTANLIKGVFEEKNQQVSDQQQIKILERNGDGGIRITELLDEVRNFDWGLFSKLVSGGKIQLDKEGPEITIEKAQSNPNDLPLGPYFLQDAAFKDSLSEPEALKRISETESYQEVRQRGVRLLSKMLRLIGFIDHKIGPKTLIILVTHDGLLSELTNLATAGSKFECQKGSYLSLFVEDEKLFVQYQDGEAVEIKYQD